MTAPSSVPGRVLAPAAGAPGPTPGQVAYRWLPALLLAAFVAAALHGLPDDSATFDETAHVPAGYTYLTQRDYRLNPEHPPLAKLIAGVPLVMAGARMPGGAGATAWSLGKQWDFGYEFLYRTPENDPVTLLMLARLPIVAFGVALALVVFAFARDLTGGTGARVALFGFAFCPTMLAHTRLVTTDLPAALFYVASVYGLYRMGRRVGVRSLLGVGLTLGLALATKFSALLLVPVLGALAAWRALDREPLLVAVWGPPRTITARFRKMTVLGAAFAAALVVAVGVVWAAYGFQSEGRAEGSLDADVSARTAAHLQARPLLRAAVGTAAKLRLVPQTYLDGFAYMHARSGIRASYLLGERSLTGFPLFFPVAFLVKTPLPVVILLLPGIAAMMLWGAERAWGRRSVGVAALAYVAVSLAMPLNIGQRHLAPLYPFIFIVIGALAPWLSTLRSWTGRAGLLLGTWYLASWAFITPHYLAYFNELTLGPARGDRVLADSNIDWGQDLGRLARWANAHGVARLPYAHFGSARPQSYGLTPFISLPGYSLVPPDDRLAEWTLRDLAQHDAEFVAINVTNLRGVYLPDTMRVGDREEPIGQRYYKDFWPLEPVARIGYSINVYRNPWRRRLARDSP